MSFIWGLVIVMALSLSAPAAPESAPRADESNVTGRVTVKVDKHGTRIIVEGETSDNPSLHFGFEIK